MACGACKRAKSTKLVRPSPGPRSIKTVGPNPIQLRALSIKQSTGPKTTQKLTAERLRIEKLRRLAVKKSLNR